MNLSVLGLLFGVAFGFLLSAAGFNRYETIHDSLMFRDLHMYLVMFSAIGTALPVLFVLQRRGLQTPLGGLLALPRARIERRHIAGAVIFGAGWAITASCPAPILTMVAGGGLLGLPVIAGIFGGLALRQRLAERESAAAAGRAAPAAGPVVTRRPSAAPLIDVT